MIDYYTVQPYEGVQAFLDRLRIDFRFTRMRITEPPVKLMGNSKILTMEAVGTGITVRVDGPGMVIDRLYNKILFGNEEPTHF